MGYITAQEYDRTLELSAFFNDYRQWRNGEEDDPGDLPQREEKLNVTAAEWDAYKNTEVQF